MIVELCRLTPRTQAEHAGPHVHDQKRHTNTTRWLEKKFELLFKALQQGTTQVVVVPLVGAPSLKP